MERIKRAIIRIAVTPDNRLSDLPLTHRSLLPLLSFASSLFRLSLSLRRALYHYRLLSPHRLPVPVISVGNITWGGTGKTPMVEYISRFFDQAGILPLILTRGYEGGDEAKMLQRHLFGTSAKIGLGKNRAEVAASIIKKFGHSNLLSLSVGEKPEVHSETDKVGIVHWSLFRQVEIVMINGLVPWGNGHLIPRGPLREPLNALNRADIIVIHHSNLVSEEQLKSIESKILTICSKALSVFFSELVPSHFFEIKDPNEKLPLNTVHDFVVLCVSAIGCPDSFIKAITEIGALHIHRLDFSDHHAVQSDDIKLIKDKVRNLASVYNNQAIIIVTEKDYDRDPVVLQKLCEFKVFIKKIK
ncbi:putative tetraacyldisaccharide 4'-kinase [Carex littledalei]|uniref:tetraacyldisaccharide 4'-kinase n=1 Tax=Carex littledalei TaxID=544730 RepID=A0A833QU89_9POAL|nr:putative tetraacyldisaccharide 4'-kinase [Carex littledalei]